MMEYTMEELVPIVRKLAEKHHGYESTSMTYEKAEQLMEAVLYCIRETEQINALLPEEKPSAQTAYETGAKAVKEKTKRALKWYNDLLPKFNSYGNRCCEDTFVNGLPKFFQWYDAESDPQNTILTMDYPVMKDLSPYTGVDKIYEFIRCMRLEQEFLAMFPENYVKKVLSAYHRAYSDMIENLCEIVLISVTEHILAGKALWETELNAEDHLRIQHIYVQKEFSDIREYLGNALEYLIKKSLKEPMELLEYLMIAVDNIVIRRRMTADMSV